MYPQLKKQKYKVFIIFIILLLMVISNYFPYCDASENPQEQWIKIYDHTQINKAFSVAADSSNNIIVTGFSKIGLNNRCYTIKYSPLGTELFNIVSDDSFDCIGYDVTIDSQDNIIITGSIYINADSDYYLIKYDKNGNELWNITYNSGYEDISYGVSIDSSDNIIITGESSSNFLTIKYDKFGNYIWNKSYDSGYIDCAKSIDVDSQDNIIVTGYILTDSSQKWYTIKYDSSGTELWNKVYDNNDNDYSSGVSVDSNDNVIIVGTIHNGANSNMGIFKYDKNGNIIWFKSYDSSVVETAEDVIVNDFDEIIFAGSSYYTFEKQNYEIIKYDKNGNFIWSKNYDRNSEEDSCTGVTIDNLNKIIVTGFSKDNINDFDYVTIKYGEKPVCNFTWNPFQPTTNDNVNFIDQSIDTAGEITDWFWQFGDGYSSTLENPTHQYQDRGFFTVTLTITDDDGNIETLSKQIEIVNAPPNADFSYVKSGLSNSIILFNDLSSDFDGSIDSWYWDFDDGTNSVEQNPTHQYSEFKTYSVSLTVTDNDGATDTIVRDVYVVNNPPNADFIYYIINENIVQFNDSSLDTDGIILDWLWQFGDGNTSNQKDITYEYNDYGTYNVTLTVTDNDGSLDSKIKTVSTIYPPSKITGLNVTDAKDGKLNLLWNPNTDLIVLDYYKIYRDDNFINFSYINIFQDIGLNNNQTYQYQISAVNIFGLEGEKSDIVSGTPTETNSEENNNKDNNKTGNGNNNGNGGYGSKYSDPPKYNPVADASAGEPYQGLINEEIIFNASKSYDYDGILIDYIWDFGDGNKANEMISSHIYSESNVYNVTLTVIDNDNLKDIYKTKAEIFYPNRVPQKPEIFGPTNGTQNQDYTFYTKSYDEDNDLLKYFFDFDDGIMLKTDFVESNINISLNHSWNNSGRFTIKINTSDNKTISKTTEHIIFIDAVEISYKNKTIGYLKDTNSDGEYDLFFNYDTQNETPVQKINDNQYLIDIDGDGKPDLLYNDETKETEEYKNNNKTISEANALSTICPMSILILLIILILYLFFRRKKEFAQEHPSKEKKKLRLKIKLPSLKKNIKNRPHPASIYKMSIVEIEDFVDSLPDEYEQLDFDITNQKDISTTRYNVKRDIDIV